MGSKIVLLKNQIKNTTSTKFLGLTIDETLSWKYHIHQVLPRLSSACYAIRVTAPLVSEDTLRMIYYSYAHSIISYGIIFWGNSPHSISVFKIQKQVIRIMTNSRGRESCRQLFRKLEILPLHYQSWHIQDGDTQSVGTHTCRKFPAVPRQKYKKCRNLK
jgi:hypothetical protein